MTHILIIDSRFYEDIADELVRGATALLEAEGVTFEHISVPGAFEIPAAISFAKETGKYDGYITLGCVIRGETSHYDYVCAENARGLNQLAVENHLAIGYGILTVDTRKQAEDRAAIDKGNKGMHAARTCLEMVKLKEKLELMQ